MADLLSQLIGNFQRNMETGFGQSQQIEDQLKLAELGARQQQVEQAKQQLAAQKQKMELDRLDGYFGAIDTGFKLPKENQRSYFKNVLPQRAMAFGIDPNKLNPAVQQALVESPDALRAYSKAMSAVRNGQMNPVDTEDFFRSLNDPDVFFNRLPELLEAEKERIAMDAKAQAQQLSLQSSERKQQVQIASAGDVEEAKQTSKDFVQFKSGGGFAGIKARLNSLTNSINKLRVGKVETGGLTGFAQSVLPEAITSITDPEQKAVMDVIRGAISIKGQLDSQFSAKEAQIQFNRSFDPALPTKANIEKADKVLGELKEDIKSKLDQFVRNGRMTPDEASQMVKELDSMQTSTSGAEAPAKKVLRLRDKDMDVGLLKERYLNSNNQEKLLKDIVEASGKTAEEIKKILGVK